MIRRDRSFLALLHAAPVRVKTYAEPWLATAPTSSDTAPTTAVSPAMATEYPNWSSAAPPMAVNCACCDHVDPDLVNT